MSSWPSSLQQHVILGGEFGIGTVKAALNWLLDDVERYGIDEGDTCTNGFQQSLYQFCINRSLHEAFQMNKQDLITS